METEIATFSEKKRSVLWARRVRAVAIIVVLSSIVIVGGHLPAGHDVAAHAEAVSAAPVADADYFPAHFPAPKGEPEALPATF